MTTLTNNELDNVSGGGFFDGPLMTYKVQAGETVQSIAEKFKIGIIALQEINPILEGCNQLRPGMEIQVPNYNG